jgi:hypothetical protein
MEDIIRDIIKDIKDIINKGNLNELKELWETYQNTDFDGIIAWDYVFQKVYLHACLKKKIEIVNWLELLFNQFNDIHKIAIRHTLTYGKYLLRK